MQVDHSTAWRIFRSRATDIIHNECLARIGGDRQTIRPVRPNWADVDQHVVLTPLWVCTFVHDGKAWPLLVNARTGRVAWGGRRPVSRWVVVVALVVAAVLVFVYGPSLLTQYVEATRVRSR